MKKVFFSKLVASGNDFIVIDKLNYQLPVMDYGSRLFSKKICDRQYGVGADGLLLLEKSNKADVKMRIFNADGSEAEMCGNGARCVAFYCSHSRLKASASRLNIETKAGIINTEVRGENVKIRLTGPRDLKLAINLRVNGRDIKANFINTGVPHAVIFVQGLEKIDVDTLGREIRYHRQFQPAGTNVNFVEVLKPDSISLRTYERGVEAETLACGTGSVAAALITSYRLPIIKHGMINVHTKSKEVLKVFFDKRNNIFSDIWLAGKAGIVFKGELEV